MDSGDNYEVADISIVEKGRKNMELAEARMGALLKIKERFADEKPLKGIRVGMALHITKEAGILVRTLIAGGAEVAITGCNPLSTQDDVAAALAKEGVRVWGYKGENKDDYYRYINNVIKFKPHVTIDDGCDLVSEIHKKHADMIPEILGGCEETTTGIIRLNAMERDGALKYPVIAVNDNKTKHMLDNYYGTGQSSLDGIIRATNVLFAGKKVVVCGYGSCGRGVAVRAKGLGSNVIVTEVDNFRALQASLDGHTVMPIDEAAAVGDIFVTVTGNKHVIKLEHMKKMKDGTILANSGHFDLEIDKKALKEAASSERNVRPNLDEYLLDGKRIYLAGEGRLVNLAAAEGHPSEVMSTSFCGQALAVEYIVKNKGKLKPGVISLSERIDNHIAGLQLEAMQIRKDIMDVEQEAYMASWQEGT